MTTKKEIILENAAELFYEKGFSGTSTKEIALKSGVAEGLIFYHFKDKNGLLMQLIQRYSFIGTIQKQLAELSELDPYHSLAKFGELYTEFLYSNRKFLLFVWSPEMIANNELRGELGNALASMHEFTGDLLVKTVGLQVDEKLIEIASSMFLSTLMTYVLIQEKANKQTSIETKEYVKKVIEMVLNGLLPKNG